VRNRFAANDCRKVEVTFRMRVSILMQRGGFGAVCGPRRQGAPHGIGAVGEEKSSALVEMRGRSVLRCKPCGQFFAGAGPGDAWAA
jgi:hypothetical protein